MSSRIQEKERRKAERLAAQRRAEEAAAKKRRLQMVGGGLVAVAIVVALAVALLGGGSSTAGLSANSSVSQDIAGIKLPAAKITDLKQAAAAAGCTLHTYPAEGRTHVTVPVTYKTNPPTSGNHDPIPATDGVYASANTPAKEHFVHTLEHGRVEYQYRPGTPVAQIKELEALWNETYMGAPGYKQLLFQNNTNMPYAVAATAWTQLIGCPTFNPKIFDALRDFRNAYIDKGPEQIPPT
ncbi:MAG TPA: DUF3105 domain-containing protein [Solirubrobacteraceae bacterium]|nr:DUF3105 domain-containing protein [Solirubrobacteraceae bacterium]